MMPSRRTLGLLAGGGSFAAYLKYRRHRIPTSGLVLELDLSKVELVEKPESPLKRLSSSKSKKSLLLRDAISALDAASKDERVTGLVARLGGAELSLATTQELGDAIERMLGL